MNKVKSVWCAARILFLFLLFVSVVASSQSVTCQVPPAGAITVTNAKSVYDDWKAQEAFMSPDCKKTSESFRKAWWNMVKAKKCAWLTIPGSRAQTHHKNRKAAKPGFADTRRMIVHCPLWSKNYDVLKTRYPNLTAAQQKRLQCDCLIAALIHECVHAEEDIGDTTTALDATCNHVAPWDSTDYYFTDKLSRDPLYAETMPPGNNPLREAAKREAEIAGNQAHALLELWDVLSNQ